MVQHIPRWEKVQVFLFLHYSEEFCRFWLGSLLYLRAYLLNYSSSACFQCEKGLIASLPQSCCKTLSSSSLFLSKTFLLLPRGALLPLPCYSVSAWSTAASFLSKPVTVPNHWHCLIILHCILYGKGVARWCQQWQIQWSRCSAIEQLKAKTSTS